MNEKIAEVKVEGSEQKEQVKQEIVKVDPKLLNLHQKLVKVRSATLYVSKSQKGYNFQYAGAAELLAVIRPIMDEMNLLLVPNVEEFELIKFRKEIRTNKVQERNSLDASHIYGEIQIPKIVISYTWINADNPSEQLRVTLPFFEDKMTGCQGIGSLLTYAERYFLYKFFQVATDHDSPEEFYKKHELMPTPEIVPVSEEKPVEKKTFKPNIDICREIAISLWDRLLKQVPTLNATHVNDLPYYLYSLQEQQPTVDIRTRFNRPCSDPKAFIAKVGEWCNTFEGKYMIDQLSHVEYYGKVTKPEESVKNVG